MAETTKIAWTHASFNPWVGCSKISPGCDSCYAEAWAKRSNLVKWGPGEPRRRTSSVNWGGPRKWNLAAKEAGVRKRVFCASLADVFDNEVPKEWRADLWALIRATPNLDWLVLTKRVGNVKAMLPADWGAGYANVWLGISVVNQEEASRDIPKLRAVPAQVRFLSCEPLLGPINLSFDGWLEYGPRSIDWVIVGGESGHYARVMQERWVREIAADRLLQKVAFFMKQGSQENWPDFKNVESFPIDLRARQWPR